MLGCVFGDHFGSSIRWMADVSPEKTVSREIENSGGMNVTTVGHGPSELLTLAQLCTGKMINDKWSAQFWLRQTDRQTN